MSTKFQRRHYEAVARQLAGLKVSALVTVTPDTQELWKLTVGTMGWMFANDNPRFNKSKFLEACGVEQ